MSEREVLDKEGNVVILKEVKRGDAVDRARLEIDTLKWVMSKTSWRVYGARAPINELPKDSDGDDNVDRVIIEGGLPDDPAAYVKRVNALLV